MWDPIIKVAIDNFFSSEFYINNKVLVDLFDGVMFGILLTG
jgi:hypothetical protein